MSLSTRVSMFFMCMVICILFGFSVVLYVIAKEHLYHEAEEELEGALNALVAAVEVKPDSVEWEPRDRRLLNVEAHHGNDLTWMIQDDLGKVIDQSSPQLSPDFLHEMMTSLSVKDNRAEKRELLGERWHLQQRALRAANPKPSSQPSVDHSVLYITAGMSIDPTLVRLQRLRWTLVAISLAIFVPTLLLGRFICNRALSPITQMALATKVMRSDRLDQRLPVPASRDELNELSRSFNDLLDRVQVSFERQRRFTGDASHQLRTPIAAILGQVEVALRRERTIEEYQQTLRVVEARSHHLIRIVESLLFLARSDGEASANHDRIDLAHWLSLHLENWASHERYNDIHVNIVASPIDVETHSALLGELLDILIDNACRYSGDATPINITLRRFDEHPEFEIQDYGVGIGADDLEKVFDPFYRSPKTMKETGCGLGLSIAKRIATALNLSLCVKSSVGTGASFVITFERTSTNSQR